MDYYGQIIAVKLASASEIRNFFATFEKSELRDFNQKIALKHNEVYAEIQMAKVSGAKTKAAKQKLCDEFKISMVDALVKKFRVFETSGYQYFIQ